MIPKIEIITTSIDIKKMSAKTFSTFNKVFFGSCASVMTVGMFIGAIGELTSGFCNYSKHLQNTENRRRDIERMQNGNGP